MPPTAAATYRNVSESANEFMAQAIPQRAPPIRTTIFGPNRSTNQPSTGTSQVSVNTKMLKATCIEARPQWYFVSIGPTKSVQPYCRLAIIVMQMMPRTSITQRTPGGRIDCEVALIDISIPMARCFEIGNGEVFCVRYPGGQAINSPPAGVPCAE